MGAKRRKRMEMSKLLLIISDIMSGITLVLTFIAVFMMGDLSPLAFLVPGVFGLSSIAHGFYFWKAKSENLKKFGQAGKISMSGEDAGMSLDDYSGSGTGPGSFG